MDGKFQTSFIPKKPMVADARTRSAGVSLFMVLGIFIFATSLIFAGLVFAGQRYFSARLDKYKKDFVQTQEAFDPITVDTLVRLDKRIEAAKKILYKHTVVLPIFDDLESQTLKNVSFKGFDLSFSDNAINLDLKGEAKNFNAVALQSDVFAKNKSFINPMISDIDLNIGGEVTFSFNARIDPNLILYENAKAAGNNEN